MGEITPERLFKCDWCGKVDNWGDGWRQKTFLHYHYDEIITVCSEECGAQWDLKKSRRRDRTGERK